MNTPVRQPFALTHDERNSALWQKLLTHLDDRIQQLRAQNDTVQPEDHTAALRGRIAELKYLRSLNTERQSLQD